MLTTVGGQIEDYAVLGRIGEGAHGIVMKGRHKRSGKVVALKKVLLKRLEDGIPTSAIREIKALQVLEGDHVVKLLEVFPQGLGFVLVFEFMVSDLGELINDFESPINEPLIKTYSQMLLKGVAFMHSNSIMHRDLKPANLLISETGQLKIADLGLCRIFTRDNDGGSTRRRHYSHQVATRWYRAPELLYGSRTYSQAVDLWSVGCIFGEMINRSPIFPGENDIDQLGIVVKALGTPNEDVWPGVADLPDYSKITFPETRPMPLEDILAVEDCTAMAADLFQHFVVYDENARLSASQALKHPYFNVEPPSPLTLDEVPKPKPKPNCCGPAGSSSSNVLPTISDMFRDIVGIMESFDSQGQRKGVMENGIKGESFH